MPNKRSTIEMTEEETRHANGLLPPGVGFDEGYIQNWTDEHIQLRDLAPLIDYLNSINVDPYA